MPRSILYISITSFESLYYICFILQDTFNDTRITISGLNAVTTYRFQIFAENGVSHMQMQPKSDYADIVVTTEASVASSITNIRVTSVKSTEIALEWDAPSVSDSSDIESDLVETYEVTKICMTVFSAEK